MKIEVANLSPEITEDDLREAFAPFGEVASVELRERSRKSEKSARILMPEAEEAWAAVEALKGRNLKGYPLQIVKPAGRQSSEKRGPRRHPGDRQGGARGGRR